MEIKWRNLYRGTPRRASPSNLPLNQCQRNVSPREMPLKPGSSDDKRQGKRGSRLHRMASLSLSPSSKMIQNINIAPVSLITHGPMSSLRTLHGVHIPRDGDKQKEVVGCCLCAFLEGRRLEDPFSLSSSSLVLHPRADVTRQKYCDWSAIERDYYLRSTMEREREIRSSLAKLGSSPSIRGFESKNIIFSGSVGNVSLELGQRDDKGGIWIFLRMIRFDVGGGEGRVFDFEYVQPLLSRYYGSMRFRCFFFFPLLSFPFCGRHFSNWQLL